MWAPKQSGPKTEASVIWYSMTKFLHVRYQIHAVHVCSPAPAYFHNVVTMMIWCSHNNTAKTPCQTCTSQWVHAQR